MNKLKKIIINAFTIALTIWLAIGILVWGAYAIWTLNKNFTSGSQLQAQDLQDIVNKLNEVTNKLNQVEGTANSAYNTASSWGNKNFWWSTCTSVRWNKNTDHCDSYEWRNYWNTIPKISGWCASIWCVSTVQYR